jgi:hypothetical protein
MEKPVGILLMYPTKVGEFREGCYREIPESERRYNLVFYCQNCHVKRGFRNYNKWLVFLDQLGNFRQNCAHCATELNPFGTERLIVDSKGNDLTYLRMGTSSIEEILDPRFSL